MVTHPFHPLQGQEFALVTYRYNWGEDRVYCHDADGKLSSLPASWTSVAAKDPFRELAAGRCLLRFIDVLELLALVRRIEKTLDSADSDRAMQCLRDYAADVHTISPQTGKGASATARANRP